ncbi:ankyrin repeat domain-containing protein, partial [Aspergillus novofumigatus IBT 16806]
IEELLAAGADVNAEGWKKQTPLAWATIKGNKATTELLLSVDNLNDNIPDTDGRTPLSHAVELGLARIVQLLLDSNADINLEDKCGRTPLLWATQEGHQTLLLLTSRADINLEDKLRHTPLLWATRKGHETIVSKLLASAGVDVDRPDSEGRAALSYAADLGYASIVQALINANAHVNSEDNKRRTPLVWATVTHQANVVQIL